MELIKVVNLVKNHIGDEAFGADGGGIIELATMEVVRVVTKYFALTCCRADF
jgi:hypothetical protein